VTIPQTVAAITKHVYLVACTHITYNEVEICICESHGRLYVVLMTSRGVLSLVAPPHYR
jgi:hypothetical protein